MIFCHNRLILRPKDNVQRQIDQVGLVCNVIKGCGEKPELVRAPRRRQQEYDTRMKFDLAITPAKFDGVVGDQGPIFRGDDLQEVPIGLAAQP